MKLEFSQQFFGKYINIKVREIRLIWSRVAACGNTDMEKLIVARHNFANVPNNTCAHAGVGG